MKPSGPEPSHKHLRKLTFLYIQAIELQFRQMQSSVTLIEKWNQSPAPNECAFDKKVNEM